MKKFVRMGSKSRQPGFSKLRATRSFREIHERIRQGWPPTELARWIQEDREEYTDVTRAALMLVLRNYRQAIPPGELVERRIPQAVMAAKEKLAKGVDEVVELEELYRLQMDRVKIDYEKERAINKLFPSMSTEIKEARSLLESLMGMKIQLGLRSAAPQEHNINITADVDERLTEDAAKFAASEAIQGVLESPEARRRVTGVVDRFLRLSEKTKQSMDAE
jgi:hypothetical protein